MKRIIVISLVFILSILSLNNVIAQVLTGSWIGALKFGEHSLPIVVNVNKQNGEVLHVTLESPMQSAKDIDADSAIFRDGNLSFYIAALNVRFTGKLMPDTLIDGTFEQNGMNFPLILKKGKYTPKVVPRPQDPQEPFSYFEEDIYFENLKVSIILTGTITVPKHVKNPPVVVLVSGSGAQNRNGEILNHRPFWVIADYLTQNGIAVLRYDERGVGQSTGKFQGATTYDFANDVHCAIDYLKSRNDINTNRIGIIGHSEGGVVAPLVASQRKDIGFLILLGAPGYNGAEILLMQQEAIALAMGINKDTVAANRKFNAGLYKILLEEKDNAILTEKVTNYISTHLQQTGITDQKVIAETIENTLQIYTEKWMLNFMRHEPVPVLKQIKCPVLAITGSNDLQVPATINLESIKKTLSVAGNKKVTIVNMPNHNHLMQESETGLPAEYGKTEQTFSPKVLEKMLAWLQSLQ